MFLRQFHRDSLLFTGIGTSNLAMKATLVYDCIETQSSAAQVIAATHYGHIRSGSIYAHEIQVK